MKSILTKRQTKSYVRVFTEDHQQYSLNIKVRYDDECGNGHNTFAITADLIHGRRLESCGCLHELVAKHCPELAPYLKWHLTSSDGPMYYIANSIFHAYNTQYGPVNYDHFRSSAVWPEISDEEIQSKTPDEMTLALNQRLPALMDEFKTAVESLGFTY
jgi:hypothetical protein